MIILIFSGAGVMGWAFWKDFPFFACFIISAIQLGRLLQPHLLPTEKQVDKLDSVVDFYFDYYNKLEELWMDYESEKLTEIEAKDLFYKIKATEKPINKIINEIVKTTKKKLLAKTDRESTDYLTKNFN
ncbi:hypothetical protein ASU31_00915 [Pedobacter ginsenosidimutans]|uniref:SMODS and SLOG-associating 2TM effector domain-containing protein n=1 Tax=Pedobacter ginsenosidimutans TaxID=687842 RepID=A0A0T5VVU9_9SPHI|nr:hypothetical protein [Pedobacter ginsenosidimutans]KRT17887.1 hypothetical protein ASU31_00915 [Pedobacter ginsenosidimutans]